MWLDKANIFKLSDDKFEEYESDPFQDCFDSTKDFAEALKRDIETKETPHVLLLEAEYGMGKTFFSTRFAYYLDKKCGIDTIYFSVWEKDYCDNPFIAFSKELINIFREKYELKDKVGGSCKFAIDSFINVIKATSIDFSSVGLPVSIDNEKLFENFKQETDPILEFKEQLRNYIAEKTTSKKLVIIVDELDRCRPDYAMKTLECIKHFFDIEGLFIILPTNKAALNDAIKCLHGICNKDRQNKECYFNKFFNDLRELKKPTESDYKHIIYQYINKELLEEAFNKEFITVVDGFNCIDTLINSAAKYSHKAGITPRELKNMCYEIVRMCNNFYEPVRCEWLTCLFAYKQKIKDLHFPYPLPQEHCFYAEKYMTSSQSKNGKSELFELNEYTDICKSMNTIGYDPHTRESIPYEYNDFITESKKTCRRVKSYEEAEEFLNIVSSKIEVIEKKFPKDDDILKGLTRMKSGISLQKAKIQLYYDKYGSDDFDSIREMRYKDIVENPELLYSASNQ